MNKQIKRPGYEKFIEMNKAQMKDNKKNKDSVATKSKKSLVKDLDLNKINFSNRLKKTSKIIDKLATKLEDSNYDNDNVLKFLAKLMTYVDDVIATPTIGYMAPNDIENIYKDNPFRSMISQTKDSSSFLSEIEKANKLNAVNTIAATKSYIEFGKWVEKLFDGPLSSLQNKVPKEWFKKEYFEDYNFAAKELKLPWAIAELKNKTNDAKSSTLYQKLTPFFNELNDNMAYGGYANEMKEFFRLLKEQALSIKNSNRFSGINNNKNFIKKISQVKGSSKFISLLREWEKLYDEYNKMDRGYAFPQVEIDKINNKAKQYKDQCIEEFERWVSELCKFGTLKDYVPKEWLLPINFANINFPANELKLSWAISLIRNADKLNIFINTISNSINDFYKNAYTSPQIWPKEVVNKIQTSSLEKTKMNDVIELIGNIGRFLQRLDVTKYDEGKIHFSLGLLTDIIKAANMLSNKSSIFRSIAKAGEKIKEEVKKPQHLDQALFASFLRFCNLSESLERDFTKILKSDIDLIIKESANNVNVESSNEENVYSKTLKQTLSQALMKKASSIKMSSPKRKQFTKMIKEIHVDERYLRRERNKVTNSDWFRNVHSDNLAYDLSKPFALASKNSQSLMKREIEKIYGKYNSSMNADKCIEELVDLVFQKETHAFWALDGKSKTNDALFKKKSKISTKELNKMNPNELAKLSLRRIKDGNVTIYLPLKKVKANDGLTKTKKIKKKVIKTIFY